MNKLIEIINLIRDNKNFEKLSNLEGEQNLMTDLGFDSLDLAELTVRCEKEFGVDIFADGIITTVAEILNQIDE
jgi:acyl carrier protein